MVHSANKPRVSDHGRLILGQASNSAPTQKKKAGSQGSATAARDSKLVAGGRHAKAGHGANTGVTSQNGVVGVRANKPAAFVVELGERKLKAERDADGKWSILGSHPKFDAEASALVGKTLTDNPGQIALGIYALAALGEPRRALEQLTLPEVRTIAGEVDQALAERSVRGDARRYLKHLKGALNAALRTPDLASAQETAKLEHPLLGNCVVKLQAAERSFTFGIKDGALVQKDFGGPEAHLLNYLAVQQSDALEPAEKAHLLAQIAPKLTITEDGIRQIELHSSSYRHWQIQMHPDGRMESKDGNAEWKPTVGPAQALLFLAALDAADPAAAKQLRARLFQSWQGGADNSIRYYGGYINQPEQKFLGVSVEGPVYTYGTRTSVSSTKTNFLAGMHSPYRWSDGWDTSDGGAAFSMIAMAEVARQNGRSVLEEIRPVVDFEGNGSHFTLRDLRGESASYEGRVTRDGGGVQKYSNGYYAPSGYAYETAGYKEPTDPIYGAFLAVRPYLAAEMGWGPIDSVATIEPKGDAAIVRSAKLRAKDAAAANEGPKPKSVGVGRIEAKDLQATVPAHPIVLHKVDFGDTRKIEQAAPQLLRSAQAAMEEILEQGGMTPQIQRSLSSALKQARNGELGALEQLLVDHGVPATE